MKHSHAWKLGYDACFNGWCVSGCPYLPITCKDAIDWLDGWNHAQVELEERNTYAPKGQPC